MKNLFLSSALVAVVAMVSCGPSGPDPDLICDADAGTASFSEVYPIMVDKCQRCHKTNGDDTTAPSYGKYETDAGTYTAVVGVKSRYAGTKATLKVVDPGDVANSSLWLKVNGGSPNKKGPNGETVGGGMPNDGTSLSTTQLSTIKKWICGGAAP